MLVLTSLFFVACGKPNYSKVSVSCDQESLTLLINEEGTLNFSINNMQKGMSQNLTFSLDGHSIVYEASAPSGGATSVSVKAIEAGQSVLTATCEGQKSCQVVINVLKPSQNLSNAENGLYVTDSKALEPNSSDFVFDPDAQLRNLVFNFYGKTERALSLTDIQQNGEFVNEFRKVFLVSNNEAKYLIFENSQAETFTLIQTQGRYSFAQAPKVEEGYSLPLDALEVNAGEKFTFIARYIDNEEKDLFVQRDFYVYSNLNKDSVNVDLTYDGPFAKELDDTIILIPNRVDSLVDYGMVKADFSIAASLEAQEFIRVSASFKDENVANKIEGVSYNYDGRLYFPFEITSATSQSLKTSLLVRFYYAGLENEKDDEVSVTIEVPIEIVYQPNDLIINDGNNETVVLYDKYNDDVSGWKSFYLNLNPTDALFDKVIVEFDNRRVSLRYRGEVIDSGKAELYDLSYPFEIRGLRENGLVTEEGEELSINVKVVYTLGDETYFEPVKEIKYVVERGAERIKFDPSYTFSESGMIFMSYNGDSSLEETFSALIAEGNFSNFDVNLERGDDVVNIVRLSDDKEKLENGDTRIKFNLKAKGYGIGIYRVTLDNGVRQTFSVRVMEELDFLSFSILQGESIVKKCTNIEKKEDNLGKTYFESEIFILHNNQPVDFKIYPNGKENSQAIEQAVIKARNEQGFTAFFDFENMLLRINAASNGSGDVTLSLSTYVISNFERKLVEIDYKINIVSYSFISNFKVEQVVGNGLSSASYIDLYANAIVQDSVKLQISGDSGFLFLDPNSGDYIPSEFDERFVYFTSNVSVSGELVGERMVYGKSYTLGGGIARFDTQSMTITPLRRGVFELYATVMQYSASQPRVFAIRVTVTDYIQVTEITTRREMKTLDFSAVDTKAEFVVYVSPENANTKAIKAVYTPTSDINIFGENGINVTTIDEREGIFLITLDASKFVYDDSYKGKVLGGELVVAPTDWLSGDVVVRGGIPIEITINYQTGDVLNPIILKDADDVFAIRNNLDAHYAIATAIDLAGVDMQPLGAFSGSIIGRSEYAKISGIKVSTGVHNDGTGVEAYDYGLFSEILSGALIRDVAFEGYFAIPDTDKNEGRRMGIVAGLNSGTLENVGVTLSQNCTVIANNNSNGLRLGGVVGGNRGDIVQGHISGFVLNDQVLKESKIATKITFYAGNNTISIDATNLDTGTANVAQIRAGGITARNIGTIRKTNNDSGLGYANYMAYANISVINRKPSAEIKDFIGGLVGASNQGSIYSDTDSIIVGGRIEGYHMVAGVVASFANDSLAQTQVTFKGITSRVFVRGNENVGAITAKINVNNGDTVSTFAVEAVDDLRTREESSMIIKYISSSNSSSDPVNNKTIAFGSFNNYLTALPTVVTYLKRTHRPAGELVDIGTDSYYGDYIEITTNQSGERSVSKQNFFTPDDKNLSVEKNRDFASFEKDKADAVDVYYMFYFKAGSVSFANGEDALASAQNVLDQDYNTVQSQSSLYPIIASKEIILEVNSNLLQIAHDGKMTVKGTGVVDVICRSVLNASDSMRFKILIVNYFNHSSEYSVLYPSLSTDIEPFPSEGSYVNILGSGTVNQYIRPNYSLFETEGLDDETSVANQIIQANGIMNVDGISVSLAPNTSLTALPEFTADFNVSVIDQMIILRRNQNLKDNLNFDVKIKPYLAVDGGKFYVNKEVSYQVRYQPVAISISSVKYDKASITTGQTLKDVIVLETTAAEDDIIVEILDGNNVVSENLKDEVNKNTLFRYSAERIGNSTSFNLSIQINTGSDAYNNRFNENIYKTYTLVVKAKSDPSVKIEIPLTYENVAISNILIDNYHSRPTGNETLPSSSDVSRLGEEGILALTISPDTADFDYILIENAQENRLPGNGYATFALVAKTTNSNLEPFENSLISGAITDDGIRLTLDDILKVYNAKDHENYHGVIYLSYIVSALGVSEGGTCTFIVTAVKDGKANVVKEKTVDLILQQYVYISLEGKETSSFTEPSYEVARGRKYKINIDSYGFNESEIEIEPEEGDKNSVVIVKEEGERYLQVLNAINYNGADGKTVTINVTAQSQDGYRYASSKMTLTIRDFVVNYNNATDANSDIIKGMDNGHINIQIGNSYSLEVDISSFIEFNENDDGVVRRVREFMNDLRDNGTWHVYTNLRGNVSTGESLDDVKETDLGSYDNAGFTKDTRLNMLYFSSNGSFNFVPLRTHTYSQNYYYFTFSARFKESANGQYAFDENGTKIVQTRFTFNVFTSSSNEHPIPIDKQQALMEMNEGAYYILTEDIVLNPSTFSPIVGNFKSFDGNGHTITFASNFDFGNAFNIGLFSRINEGSVVKNLKVALSGGDLDMSSNTHQVRFRTTSSGFNVGLIAGENNGVITNCEVTSLSLDNATYNTFLVVEGNENGGSGYVAGLVGANSGYITNSRSSIYARGIYNLSGIVGTNNGKIASTYFKNGVLIGLSSEQNVAGFAISNGQNGRIITSYVSGQNNRSTPFSLDTDHFIQSTTDEAGFVLNNQGVIEDSYSNIKMLGSSRMAGFVYENSGEIRKSFSLSILVDNSTSSAGFAMTNVGTTKDCFYFKNDQYNKGLVPVDFEGVEALDENGFKDYDANFANFIYSNSKTSDSVWFVSDGAVGGEDSLFGSTVFSAGRLELVSANIIAFAQSELQTSQADESTGDISYSYIQVAGAATGELKNPIIIYDAQTMENEILKYSDSNHLNNKNIRLVSDIDYQDFDNSSQIYKTIYAATLEGNGMEIRNMSLISNEKLNAAGMFAQLGYNALNRGVVMNVSLAPRNLAFPSTTSVGGLAGVATYSNVYNVSISTSNNLTIVGNNFVGGLIGRSAVSNDFKNLSSNVSVTANFRPSEDFRYIENRGGENQASYAGSVFGFMGQGELSYVYASEVGTVLGDRAGYIFGGIGAGADVKFVYSNIGNESRIKANRYGGMVAGENSGKISFIDVYGSGETSSVFAVENGFLPDSLGGIAGVASGEISNAVVSQSFRVGSLSSSATTVENVGGLVGKVANAGLTMKNAIFSGNISASGGNIGGAVGQSNQRLDFFEIVVSGQTLSVQGENQNVIIGGIVGLSTAFVNMSNSYCTTNISINIYNYRLKMGASAGGLIASSTYASLKNCFSRTNITASIEDRSVVTDSKNADPEDILEPAGTSEGVFYSGAISLVIKGEASLNHFVYGIPMETDSIAKSKGGELEFFTNDNSNSSYSYMLPGAEEIVYVDAQGNIASAKNATSVSGDWREDQTAVPAEWKFVPEKLKLSNSYLGKFYKIDKNVEVTHTDSDGLKTVNNVESVFDVGTEKAYFDFLDKRFVLYENEFVKASDGSIKQLSGLNGKYVEITYLEDGSLKFDENSYFEGFEDRGSPYLFFETNLYWLH